jgi:hypothetical protein
MAAMSQRITVQTKKEVRAIQAAFKKEAKKKGFKMQTLSVNETSDGYEIYMRAHT